MALVTDARADASCGRQFSLTHPITCIIDINQEFVIVIYAQANVPFAGTTIAAINSYPICQSLLSRLYFISSFYFSILVASPAI